MIEESVLPDGEGQLREVVRPRGSDDAPAVIFFDVAAVVSWSKSNAESGCKLLLLLLFLPVCLDVADAAGASTSSA